MKPVRNRRVSINREFASAAAFIREYMANVSQSGAFVQTATPLPVGTRVKLRFTIMLDDPEVLEGLGEVVRVSVDPPGMGVAFVQLPDASRRLLQRLLTRHPT